MILKHRSWGTEKRLMRWGRRTVVDSKATGRATAVFKMAGQVGARDGLEEWC